MIAIRWPALISLCSAVILGAPLAIAYDARSAAGGKQGQIQAALITQYCTQDTQGTSCTSRRGWAWNRAGLAFYVSPHAPPLLDQAVCIRTYSHQGVRRGEYIFLKFRPRISSESAFSIHGTEINANLHVSQGGERATVVGHVTVDGVIHGPKGKGSIISGSIDIHLVGTVQRKHLDPGKNRGPGADNPDWPNDGKAQGQSTCSLKGMGQASVRESTWESGPCIIVRPPCHVLVGWPVSDRLLRGY